MLNGLLRDPVTRVITPLAKGLLRTGISPGAVTAGGAIGAVVASTLLIPTGHLFAGALVVGAFAISDLLDGTMARVSGRTSKWGAFFDSNLDRVTDAAIFGSIAVYYSTRSHLFMVLSLIGMVSGFLVSYARASAESLGFKCSGGLIERAERLIIVLVAIGLAGLDIPYMAAIGLWSLALGSTFTFAQRLIQVHAVGRAA
jgi:CDP-diacylglycerol--glycerol-3-phosphate 3-phosphatidyltransferase